MNLLPLKIKVSKILLNEFVGRIISYKYKNLIPFWNCKIDCSSSTFTNKMKASIYFRAYEGAEVRFIRKYLPTHNDVIELGASLGIVSAHIIEKLENNARLFCVEANPMLIKDLERNLKLNKKENSNYVIINQVLDYSLPYGSIVNFYANSEILVSSKTSNLDEKKSSKKFTIKNTQLSEIINQYKIAKYNLVCDIEGAEIELLINDRTLIYCEYMIIELHDTKYLDQSYSIKDLLNLIDSLGFFKLIDLYGQVAVYRNIKTY